MHEVLLCPLDLGDCRDPDCVREGCRHRAAALPLVPCECCGILIDAHAEPPLCRACREAEEE